MMQNEKVLFHAKSIQIKFAYEFKKEKYLSKKYGAAYVVIKNDYFIYLFISVK